MTIDVLKRFDLNKGFKMKARDPVSNRKKRSKGIGY